VVYLAKDARQKAYVKVHSTPSEFVAILSQHILDRYKHSMRYFGHLAPRTKKITSAGVFALLASNRVADRGDRIGLKRGRRDSE